MSWTLDDLDQMTFTLIFYYYEDISVSEYQVVKVSQSCSCGKCEWTPIEHKEDVFASLPPASAKAQIFITAGRIQVYATPPSVSTTQSAFIE